ncbi:MAG TPA: hypothetical protein VIU64_10840 [Polyangia bacterium]
MLGRRLFPSPQADSASGGFMEQAGRDQLAHALAVMPEEDAAGEQKDRCGDPSGAVAFRYAIKGCEPALRIFGRVGVREVHFPLLIRLVLVTFVEESPCDRPILRLIGKDPLRALDPLGALGSSRIPCP